jgi:hypothetical protein
VPALAARGGEELEPARRQSLGVMSEHLPDAQRETNQVSVNYTAAPVYSIFNGFDLCAENATTSPRPFLRKRIRPHSTPSPLSVPATRCRPHSARERLYIPHCAATSCAVLTSHTPTWPTVAVRHDTRRPSYILDGTPEQASKKRSTQSHICGSRVHSCAT